MHSVYVLNLIADRIKFSVDKCQLVSKVYVNSVCDDIDFQFLMPFFLYTISQFQSQIVLLQTHGMAGLYRLVQPEIATAWPNVRKAASKSI